MEAQGECSLVLHTVVTFFLRLCVSSFDPTLLYPISSIIRPSISIPRHQSIFFDLPPVFLSLYSLSPLVVHFHPSSCIPPSRLPFPPHLIQLIPLYLPPTSPLPCDSTAPEVLPPPIQIKQTRFDQEEFSEVELPSGLPYFTSSASIAQVETFLTSPLVDVPHHLLIVGPIKSGKTTFIRHIVPALAFRNYRRHAQAMPDAASTPPRLPVFFHHTFSSGQDYLDHFSVKIRTFAREMGISLPRASDSMMEEDLLLLGNAIHTSGKELWVMLDEVQNPIINSTKPSNFIEALKGSIGALHGKAKFVITGSGMMTALTSLSRHPPNGFMLASSFTSVVLGATPSAAAAEAMAGSLILARRRLGKREHSASEVVSALRANLTNAWLLSPRPALIAYILDLADVNVITIEEAVSSALGKLDMENTRDVITSLTSMRLAHRVVLYKMALGTATEIEVAGIDPGSLLRKGLCEQTTSGAIRMLPPSSRMFAAVLGPDGMINAKAVEAVSLRGLMTLDYQEKALILGDIGRVKLSSAVMSEVSQATMNAFLVNNIGFREPNGTLRCPGTLDEVSSIPAIMTLLKSQDNIPHNAYETFLHHQQTPTTPQSKRYLRRVGFHLSRVVRHPFAHVTDKTDFVQVGLDTSAFATVIDAALDIYRARKLVIVDPSTSTLVFNPEHLFRPAQPAGSTSHDVTLF